jgi:hypothetical protein
MNDEETRLAVLGEETTARLLGKKPRPRSEIVATCITHSIAIPAMTLRPSEAEQRRLAELGADTARYLLGRDMVGRI